MILTIAWGLPPHPVWFIYSQTRTNHSANHQTQILTITMVSMCLQPNHAVCSFKTCSSFLSTKLAFNMLHELLSSSLTTSLQQPNIELGNLLGFNLARQQQYLLSKVKLAATLLDMGLSHFSVLGSSYILAIFHRLAILYSATLAKRERWLGACWLQLTVVDWSAARGIH